MTGTWYKAPGPKRDYNILQSYKIATPQGSNPKTANSPLAREQEAEIRKKMQTDKKVRCTGEYCSRIEDLGPFKVGQDMWETKCACRLARVECTDECGCDPAKCQNRQMSLKQGLVLGKDVVEKISWGIDMCTGVNLLNLLPSHLSGP